LIVVGIDRVFSWFRRCTKVKKVKRAFLQRIYTLMLHRFDLLWICCATFRYGTRNRSVNWTQFSLQCKSIQEATAIPHSTVTRTNIAKKTLL